MLVTCSAMDREKTKVLCEFQPPEFGSEFGVEKEARLILFHQGCPMKYFTLIKNHISMGGGPVNEIMLTDPYVSQCHAVIERRGDLFFLKDQESTNGTFLNGILIKETSLHHKCHIQIGKTLLQFEYIDTKFSENLFYEGMISHNPVMQQVFQTVGKIAKSRETVIIYGETGTGKELVARAVHNKSERSAGPFITLNCGAIPSELLESELFGHVKGAFTGAHHDRMGVFQAAHGGTLFLDEIGELSLSLQPKLLRALESREIKPLGSERVKEVDIKIVAATHRDLPKMVEEKKFREDLFYRLHLIPLYLPSLRDRREDIPVLIKHFLANTPITTRALKMLIQYEWPGNIRELRNVIERLKLLKEGVVITEQDIQSFLRTKPLPLTETIQQVERNLLYEFLEKNEWNRSQTARALSMPKTTLLDKMKKYQLQKA